MALFIETDGGKLQNLYLLQAVVAIPSQEVPNKFAVAYMQENGTLIEDLLYDTQADADAKVAQIKQKLLNT